MLSDRKGFEPGSNVPSEGGEDQRLLGRRSLNVSRGSATAAPTSPTRGLEGLRRPPGRIWTWNSKETGQVEDVASCKLLETRKKGAAGGMDECVGPYGIAGEDTPTPSSTPRGTECGFSFSSPMLDERPSMAWKPLDPSAPRKTTSMQELRVPESERKNRRNVLGKHRRISDANSLSDAPLSSNENSPVGFGSDVEMGSPPFASRRKLEALLNEAAHGRKLPRLRERHPLEDVPVDEVCAIGRLSIYDNSATGLDPSVPLSPIRWPAQRDGSMPEEPRKSRFAGGYKVPAWEMDVKQSIRSLRKSLHTHEFLR